MRIGFDEAPGPILFGASGGAAGRRRGGGADEGLRVKCGKPADGGRIEFSTGIGESGVTGTSLSGRLCDPGESGRIPAGGEAALVFVISDEETGSFWSGSVMRTNFALSPNRSTLPATLRERL